MDEPSPCLVRSFSHSDSSIEPKEVDPLRALRTSVSFGRYVSDTSSWEKWSCFSNNRYLEEAEKISKPGSVAEKKALLEAHFKKISTKKANIGTHDHEPNIDIMNNSCTPSKMVLESSETASQEVNVLDPEFERMKLDTEMEDLEKETKAIDIVEKLIQCEEPKLPDKEGDHTKNLSSKQEKRPIIDHDNQGNSVSTSKKKQPFGKSKLFTDILASKFRSSLKLSPSQPKKEDNTAQISKKTERGTLEKKNSTVKLLHMSVDYSSRFGENSKRSTPMVQKTGDSKGVQTFSKISRDTSTPRQIPTRASVAGTLTQPSATIQIIKSIKTLDKPPVPRSTSEPQCPLIDSKTRGHNTQSSIVASSPFSLRCEGRVAKRKEYFQKLEEKQKAKEAEKVHLQAKSKVPLIRPQTPKDGSRPLWRPDKISDATKTKEKNTRTPIRSSCTILRKNKIENASPNIQRWL